MAWLDPQWFTLEALSAEWRRKDIRKWLIGVATTVVVLALLCHPESAPAALAIDSVGIDAFLAVLELQVLVGCALYSQQLMALIRAAYVSNHPLGALLRKPVSLVRNGREAMRGSYR
ncbi:hypothetical protein [Dyella telluris]|uniref:Uncharacterized protein n=1 Tax=Dyella telluris TaxID=2763498 RepID=A0A7G8Q5R3_9GAMM|nr:hypothetical protein [Dyella telluris]QNK02121.1 hypothetical protein H8F01_02855 [Dyella telluris]